MTTYHVWMKSGQMAIVENVAEAYMGNEVAKVQQWTGERGDALVLMPERPKYQAVANWQPLAVFIWSEIAGFAIIEVT